MLRKVKIIGLIIVLILILSGGTAFARPLVIKLGTPTPSGSEWNDVLQELADEWREISGDDNEKFSKRRS